MRRRLLLAVAAVFAAAAVPAEPPSPPVRIASLNLTADEVLVDILPPGRLVAVTRFADEVGTSNVVGRVPTEVVRMRADLERLVALSPDLVVVSEYHDADFLRQLEKSGLRWYRMERLDSLAGFRAAILGLGHEVGEDRAAARLVAVYDARLAALARRLAGTKRPRVLYWSNPYTAGAHTAYDAIIECGGGDNVGRALGLEGIAPLGAERAFMADPDVVLVGESFESLEALKHHPLLGKLRAVREERVIAMPNELLSTLSHHAARSCWFLASRLHPDLVNPDGYRVVDQETSAAEAAR